MSNRRTGKIARLPRELREEVNRMLGWSHHRVTLQDAVAQGLVEKINAKKGASETREAYLARIQAECLDDEQWQQEYCCVPVDDSTAFITYEMITACQAAGCLRDFAYLEQCPNPLYVGVDFGRKKDLTVIDIGERIGDVIWDRMRIELAGATFAAQRETLYRVLRLRQVQRACLDKLTELSELKAKLMRLESKYIAEDIERDSFLEEKAKILTERKAIQEVLRALEKNPQSRLEPFEQWIKKAQKTEEIQF